MTQSMPSAQAISTTLNSATGTPAKSTSDNEFSGTFRKQLDSAAVKESSRTAPAADAENEVADASAAHREAQAPPSGDVETPAPIDDLLPQASALIASGDWSASAPIGGFYAADSTMPGNSALALPDAAGGLNSTPIPGVDGDALIANLAQATPLAGGDGGDSGEPLDAVLVANRDAAAEAPTPAVPVTGTEQIPLVAPVAGINRRSAAGTIGDDAAALAPTLAAGTAQASAPEARLANARARAGNHSPAPGLASSPAAESIALRADGAVAQQSNLATPGLTPSLSDAEAFARTFSRSGEAFAAATAQATAVTAAAAPAVAPLTAMQATNGTQLSWQSVPSVDTAFGDPDWNSALGARLVISAAQNIQSASIAINPRDLGPVNVNMTVNDDELSMSFVAQHAPVREAIEAALPKLREMFEGEGINLGDVDISAGGDEAGGGEQANADGDTDTGNAAQRQGDGGLAETSVRVSDGLVDTFA